MTTAVPSFPDGGRQAGRSSPPVGRFAPSPTGPLHVGSLVTALGSYLFARKEGGAWLVRMEDLDTPRVIPGMADDILRTLEVFGLQWDGEVVCQSRRTEAYAAVLDDLKSRGQVYPCGCSRAEIARAASAPHPGEEGPIYPGTCRNGLPETKTPRAFRLRVDAGTVTFQDRVQGSCSQDLEDCCGDFVVKRADGPFAYHLAVVVDDEAAGVTQVVRGADLLPSTPRQVYLQQLLGYRLPGYAHLPLVTSLDGSKLSKRDNAVSIAVGTVTCNPGRLLNAALRFLGQIPPPDSDHASPGEILSWAVRNFDPERIRPFPAPFGTDVREGI